MSLPLPPSLIGTRTIVLPIEIPLARADLSRLCGRVRMLLEGSNAGVVLCDLSAVVDPDAVTVDALARLQLTARRLGREIRLRHASNELRDLVAFMGLADVLCQPATHKEEPMVNSMSRKIFVNLPVGDLDRSVEFFSKLGFAFDPRFTDEAATCMVVSDEAYVMLLVESRFRDFTKKELVDASRQTEAILAVSAESREQVDELADKALEAGGSPANDPIDQGFMYGRSFQDPDGHLWELIWMDPTAIEQ